MYYRHTLRFYLYEAVHVGLHVGNGHPLHHYVHDPPLQSLPFLPCCFREAAAHSIPLYLLPAAVRSKKSLNKIDNLIVINNILPNLELSTLNRTVITHCILIPII